MHATGRIGPCPTPVKPAAPLIVRDLSERRTARVGWLDSRRKTIPPCGALPRGRRMLLDPGRHARTTSCKPCVTRRAHGRGVAACGHGDSITRESKDETSFLDQAHGGGVRARPRQPAARASVRIHPVRQRQRPQGDSGRQRRRHARGVLSRCIHLGSALRGPTLRGLAGRG
ncbi:MAG: hypothetical protein RL153_1127, partial [Verrucomicrobiota bacterium]